MLPSNQKFLNEVIDGQTDLSKNPWWHESVAKIMTLDPATRHATLYKFREHLDFKQSGRVKVEPRRQKLQSNAQPFLSAADKTTGPQLAPPPGFEGVKPTRRAPFGTAPSALAAPSSPFSTDDSDSAAEAEVDERCNEDKENQLPKAPSETCSCGTAFMPGAKFCGSCGSSREESNPPLVCGCGSSFMPEQKFCCNCGISREAAAATKADANKKTTAPPPPPPPAPPGLTAAAVEASPQQTRTPLRLPPKEPIAEQQDGKVAQLGTQSQLEYWNVPEGTGNLRTHFWDLHQVETGRIFMVRKINAFGFEAPQVLKTHFSKYGPVDKVLAAQSQVKSPAKARVRPGHLGFVIMTNKEDVDEVLRQGEEQVVLGSTIRVQKFEHRSDLAPPGLTSEALASKTGYRPSSASSSTASTGSGDENVHKCETISSSIGIESKSGYRGTSTSSSAGSSGSGDEQ